MENYHQLVVGISVIGTAEKMMAELNSSNLESQNTSGTDVGGHSGVLGSTSGLNETVSFELSEKGCANMFNDAIIGIASLLSDTVTRFKKSHEYVEFLSRLQE